MASKPAPISDFSHSWPLLKRLVRDYLRPHGARLKLAVICMIIVALMTAASAYMMKPMLDEVFLAQNREMLTLIPLLVIAIFLIKGVASYGQSVLLGHIGQRIVSDMQLQLFTHLLHSDIRMFHDESRGKLISRFTNDIMMMRNAVSNLLTGLAKEVLSMFFLIGLMIYQSWELSIIALVVYPITFFPIIRLGKRMRKLSNNTQQQLGQFTSQLDETFAGVRMVKAYNREDYETNRARSLIESLFGLYYKAVRVQSAASPIMETLGGLAIAGVVWYGGVQVMEGETTPGAFFSFMAALMMAYKPAKSLASLNAALQQGLAAADRFFIAIDTPAAIFDKPDAKPLNVDKGEIVFNNTTFRYTEDGAGVSDINLTIPAGKTVALVGPSGGGKSTLINLLLRFYEPQSGDVTIDGTDIRDVTLHSLREHIALVSQETVLFDDTVYANIAYGREGATEAEVKAAAKAAAADGFIADMPEGYNTIIGSHGVKLSGGQRQRLAIARAILKDAPILLLDEATSSLDTSAERQVQEALNTLMQNRTTLVIAHRLSTVTHADAIYVIEQGRIVETGSHTDLLGNKGVYSRLYHDQFEHE